MYEFILLVDEYSCELDHRQQSKVRHPLSLVLLLVFICELAGIEHWNEMSDFLVYNQSLLETYLPLEHGIPSHDTLERVIGMVSEGVIEELRLCFTEHVLLDFSDNYQRILSIDGKTVRGNARVKQQPLHIVTGFEGRTGISLGQERVLEKSNEIVAIPWLLRKLDIRKAIVTIDAMGTQKTIAEQIITTGGHYCLSVKRNQPTLYEDITEHVHDKGFLEKLGQKQEYYYQTLEQTRGQIETREYWVCPSAKTKWLSERHPDWKQLRSIGISRNRIDRNGEVHEEMRYYILSFQPSGAELASCVRGHWSVESMHWLLDVVYREDSNKTLDQRAAYHLNALRKVSLLALKHLKFGRGSMSYRRKCMYVSYHLEEILQQLGFTDRRQETGDKNKERWKIATFALKKLLDKQIQRKKIFMHTT